MAKIALPIRYALFLSAALLAPLGAQADPEPSPQLTPAEAQRLQQLLAQQQQVENPTAQQIAALRQALLRRD